MKINYFWLSFCSLETLGPSPSHYAADPLTAHLQGVQLGSDDVEFGEIFPFEYNPGRRSSVDFNMAVFMVVAWVEGSLKLECKLECSFEIVV